MKYPYSVLPRLRRGAGLLIRLGRGIRPWLRAGLGFVRRRESVKVRLFVTSCAVAVVVFVATSVTLSRTSEETATVEAERRAAELLELSAALMAESVAAEDRMQVHLFGRALLSSEAYAIRVQDAAGDVLFSSGESEVIEATPGEAGTPGSTWETVVSGERKLLHSAGEVAFGGRRVGAIHLWIDRSALQDRIQAGHASVYPVFGAGFLLLVVLGAFLLRAPFRALGRLTEVADRIRLGDLSERVPLRGRDEMARFSSVFNDMVEGLQRAREAVFAQQLQTIQAMISTVEAKDAYTQGHCLRVRNYASRILEHFAAVGDGRRERIEIAALLHDIGKIGIPDAILLKDGMLTEEELQTIRTHVTTGETILRHLDALQDVSRWVRHHHERWDGLGYPDGLRAEAIPFPSRVISVADAIDAMLTVRPYQGALNRDDVADALRAGRGNQFDPGVVDAAIHVLRDTVLESERSTHA